ncbi:MAG: carboxypeptidase-like regulatory domain-containing protein [Bacteroidota bacterium]
MNRSFLRPLCAIALLIGLNFSDLTAQSVLTGRVVDVETNEPLVGAVVAEQATETGVYTDERGRFSFETSSPRPTIKVTYIGYKETVRTLDADSDTDYTIELWPDPLQLPTTTITDSRLSRVYPDNSIQVQDFAFLEDNTLLIVYDPDEKTNVLELVAQDGTSLATWKDPSDPPRSLERDCLGNVQCISAAQAGQVDYTLHQLILRRDSLTIYRTAMAACRTLLDSTYFFEYSPSRWTKSFVYVRTDERRKRHLYASQDTHALKTIYDDALMPDKIVSPEMLYSGVRGVQAKQFQDGMNGRYFDEVQFPEPYVPIYTIGGTVCVFDHIRRKLVRFDAWGEQVAEAEISYPDLRRWKRNVIVDHAGNRAFTFTEKSGYTTVHRIDIDTGALILEWELPLPFVQKIRVRGDYIYFLYREGPYDPVKRLYRFEMI